MDTELKAFMATFARFIEFANDQQNHDAGGPAIHQALSDYLNCDAGKVPVVVKDFPAHRHADIDVALSVLAESDPTGGAQLLGVAGGQERMHTSLSEMIRVSSTYGQFGVGTVDYVSVPIGPDERRKVVGFGLWLMTFKEHRIGVLLRGPNPEFGSTNARIELVCCDDEIGDLFLGAVARLGNERSLLRGQMISLGSSDYDDSTALMTFHRRPAVSAGDVILPEGLLRRIERHVVGVGRHAEKLKAAGQHLKRGVLLYGPPGTGKTHTVRYLASQSSEATIIMLSGTALSAISYAAETARALQPSIVVLEDCDLVAQDRSMMGEDSAPLLFEVLDALDGLANDADVAFLLTTNRADILEPALAQRPGRVDLAVEIPLPGYDDRVHLFDLYAKSLKFSRSALSAAAEATEGTPASFAKELIRRAVLIAVEDGREPGDDDLRRSADELGSDREAFTRGLLGMRASDEELEEDDLEFA
ncbi:ATP-binding protein [Saxibacter everestensis]|uniref:ATP-binding protein n=1 Tax=Saxibacter everestensis TaxID=2909229 RepID=A0ABY8QSV6_9MICO|nr:ATP-binding protein [Brevibacteriaceae bacterium ZFBP1038]